MIFRLGTFIGMNIPSRNEWGNIKMTRKQALLKAIEELQKNKRNDQVVTILKEICEELPLVHWTEKSILDAFQQYLNEHNNEFPSKRNLGKSLPTYNVIKKFFKSSCMTDFRDSFFPNEYTEHFSPYANYSKENITECFIRNYYAINGGNYVKYDEYDLYREPGTPSIRFIINKLNCNSYNDLLIKMNIRKKTTTFTVNSNKRTLNIYNN